ncbi:unnamed protein product [Staurois parvus]|uniref:Uncharacterized protein n=1 Tax=Staurois parvus TaxID=386267 RepID=A0ABN9AZ44_9NEOB|nr:unnamed protein product [Staurois parvus]
MQSGKYHSPGNCQTQTHPLDFQTKKCDLSLQRTCLHCSRVQWQLWLSCCSTQFLTLYYNSTNS